MSLWQWQFDAPTGTYKNHAMSMDMRKAAIAQTLFMRFTRPEPGYGKRKGESITIPRASNLTVPTDGTLDEAIGIPVDQLTLSTVAITVSEWGRALEFTNFARDLSSVDIPEAHRQALLDQMSLVMDKAAASAFKAAKVKYVPTGAASATVTTNGTAGTAALNNMNYYHVESIRDYLYRTLAAPFFVDGDYIGIFATKGMRGIKDDPKFEQWNVYTNREAKMNGEVGRIENIRFIESNHDSALSNSKGTGSVLGEGVIFGRDAVASAIAEDPELRMAQPSDFGRTLAVAWYGILQFGLIWDTGNPGEARVVHVTST